MWFEHFPAAGSDSTHTCVRRMDRCHTFRNVRLHGHQLSAVQHMLRPDVKGLIVKFAMGTGKTLTALTVARCLCDVLNIACVVITTPAVVPGFKRELERLPEIAGACVPLVTTYGKFLNAFQADASIIEGKLLVVDEAHNFRNPNGSETRALIAAARKASKVLLLTGTPVHNTPVDIVPLLCMIDRGDRSCHRLQTEFEGALEKFENAQRERGLLQLLAGNVIVYANDPVADPNYPSVIRETLHLTMPKDYLRQYMAVERVQQRNLPDFLKNKDITFFLNGLRRATNRLHAPSIKIDKIVEIVQDNVQEGRKCLVYSAWKDSGIMLVNAKLQALGIQTVFVTGDESSPQKHDSVLRYNSNQAPVMFITKAGAEGLDLKATRCVVIMEPHWNNELLRQVEGRAARFQSHLGLDPEDQNVTVYTLSLDKPRSSNPLVNWGILNDSRMPSADEMISTFAKKKDERIARFNQVLNKASIIRANKAKG